MNRRGFLRRAGLATAAIALGVAVSRTERALAVPITDGPRQSTALRQAPSRELIVVTAAGITTLDPQESTFAPDVRVTLNLFDTLVTRTPDLALKPALATSWRLLDDRHWEFKLRDDARFHNGAPVTSRDVKFTIERALDPTVGTLAVTTFSTVDTVDTPDDRTVIMTTAQPDPLLPARLSYVGGQILPSAYLAQVGTPAFAAAPIGSGVVRFESWTPGKELVLRANPDYWGGPPDFDLVRFVVTPAPRDRVQALLDGQAHLATRLGPEWRLRISRRPEARPAEVLFAGLYALGVNVRVAPLNNPMIRQALSLAIDRQAILGGAWLGRGILPKGFVAKGDHVGYPDDWPPHAYDQDRARQLLEAAGYAGEPIVLEATDGYMENDAAMALVLRAMWEYVGINVQLRGLSIAERARKVHQRSFAGLWFSDPVSTIQDPDGMMVRLMSPGGLLDYWYDDEWMRLAFEARHSHTPEFRDGLYRQMQEIMLREMPWIPLLQPMVGYGVSSALSWQPHPTDRMELRRDVLRFV